MKENNNVKLLAKNAGFTFIEVIIAAGILSGLVFAGFQLLSQFTKESKKSNERLDLFAVRSQIISTLQDKSSFSATLKEYQNKDSFKCLTDASDCSGITSEFKLYKAGSSSVYPVKYITLSTSGEEKIGFNKAGVVCYSFNTTSGQGSDDCPYKYIATWKAICPGGSGAECRNPLLEVNVNLKHNPGKAKQLANLQSSLTDFKIVLSQVNSDKGKLCEMVSGGFLNGTDQSCNFIKMGETSCDNSICPAGTQSLVKGFYPDGSLKCGCTSTTALNCNSPGEIGKVLLGVNDDGSAVCGNGIVPGLIASGSINNTPETLYKYYLDSCLVAANELTNAYSESKLATTAHDDALALVVSTAKAAETAKAESDAAEAAAASANPRSASLDANASNKKTALEVASKAAVAAIDAEKIALAKMNASEVKVSEKENIYTPAKNLMQTQASKIGVSAETCEAVK